MVKLANFDHLTTAILKFWPRSWSKMANFDHLTTVILKFWPWSWSEIFDHLTMTPGRRPNGQKIMVILPPPPPLDHIRQSSFVDGQLLILQSNRYDRSMIDRRDRSRDQIQRKIRRSPNICVTSRVPSKSTSCLHARRTFQ